jgi:hypothetical protein
MPGPAEVCPRLAAHDNACGHAFDPNVCAKNVRCWDATMRPEALGWLTGCLANEPCQKPAGDVCFDYTSRGFQNVPDVRAFYAACRGKAATCPNGREFVDDCDLYGPFNDPSRAALRNCIAQPCDWIESCVKAVEYPPVLCH